MIRNRFTLKFLASFFLVNLLLNVLFPTLSWALTAGPTAPEATSFEPVDTTDMVNHITGDFTYNMPLLEVPGPHGGYPLSLSYHAGIQPDVEASWVGLGWTLNPGAVTRLVNGFPDDQKNASNGSRLFWEGGETKTISIGLNVSVAGMASGTMGLSFSNDTYQGFGVQAYSGGSLSVGTSIGPISGNVGVGSSGFFGGVGLSGSTKVEGSASNYLSGSIGANFSSQGVGFSAFGGISSIESFERIGNGGKTYQGGYSTSIVGASLFSSQKGLKASLSVAGSPTNAYASFQNSVSSKSSSFGFSIPTPLPGIGISLSRTKTRYWIDEYQSTDVNGSMHLPEEAVSDVESLSSLAFDVYDLQSDKNLITHPNKDKLLGGSFPNYDRFQVSGQGISGTFRPYHYKRSLVRQSKLDKRNNDEIQVQSFLLNDPDGLTTAAFRFDNDFSNRFIYPSNQFQFNGPQTGLDYQFGTGQTTGVSGQGGFFNNQLAGSKHIVFATNAELTSPEFRFAHHFLETQSTGFDRQTKTGLSQSGQIGAFKIINESGVTYHYALPAYSYAEYQKSIRKNRSNGEFYNSFYNPEPYAYTWYLTAITGPDFVDRGTPGVLDQEDWGYWVEFNYDLWLNDYQWRNPYEGYNPDVDASFENYSRGRKEQYYLDNIKTRSHVAVFHKSERLDGKEVSSLDLGGFDITNLTSQDQTCVEQRSACEQDCSDLVNDPGYQDCISACDADCSVVIGEGPRSALKLDKITLSSVEDYTDGSITNNEVLSSIEFNHSYRLQKGTPNSFDRNQPEIKQGKLTLESVQVLGKEYVKVLPPTSFAYKKNPDYKKGYKDIWGFYKSDYDEQSSSELDNTARLVSEVSAQEVDAWSLTEIITPLGSHIQVDYESDEYNNVVFEASHPFPVLDMSLINAATNTIRVDFIPGTTPQGYFNTGDSIEVLLGYDQDVIDCNLNEEISAEFLVNPYTVKVKQIGGSYIEITSQAISDLFELDGCQSGSGIEQLFNFRLANLSLPKQNNKGGGLRVAALSIETFDKKYVSEYQYQNGTTSYLPLDFDDYTRGLSVNDDYEIELYKGMESVLSNAREIPGPSVMYTNVTIKNKIEHRQGEVYDSPTYNSYEFTVFDRSMVQFDYTPVQENQTPLIVNGIAVESRIHRNMVIKDLSTRIGDLKRVKTYNAEGKKISESVKHYLHEELQDPDDVAAYKTLLTQKHNQQGIIEETIADARFVQNGVNGYYPTSQMAASKYYLLGIESRRETYPSVQTGETSFNYLTGTKTISKNLAFDFYSGAVIKSISSDSYGNYFVDEYEPAYREYPGMGLALYGGKNMLTQQAGSKTYQVQSKTDHTPTHLVAANTETWHQSFNNNGEPVQEHFFTVNEIQSLTPEGYSQVSVADPVNVLQAGERYYWNLLGGFGSFSVIKKLSSTLYAVNYYGSPPFVSGNLTVAKLGTPRKHRSYAWIGEAGVSPQDGLYPYADFDIFDAWEFGESPTSSGWQKNSEITKYSPNSNALEVTDINGNYAATRMDADDERVYSTVANAAYGEFIYSGFEDVENGDVLAEKEIQLVDGTPEGLPHTGEKAIRLLNGGGTAFTWTISGTDLMSDQYVANVWRRPFYGGAAELYAKADGQDLAVTSSSLGTGGTSYQLMELRIDVPPGTNTLEVGCRWAGHSNPDAWVRFDDFRVYPLDASMTSYVYNQYGELSHILDANNLYSRFEYDEMGRLKRTYQETLQYGENLVSDIKMRYARSNAFSSNISSNKTDGVSLLGDVEFLYLANEEITLKYDDCSEDLRITIDGIELNQPTMKIGGTLFTLSGTTLRLEQIKGSHALDINITAKPGYVPEDELFACNCNQDGNGDNTGFQTCLISDGCGGNKGTTTVASTINCPTGGGDPQQQ